MASVDDDLRAGLHAVVQVDDVLIEQPDAAGGDGLADGGRVVRAMHAMAIYIHEGNKDMIYRIHGSPEVWTMGRAVSSGCIRMINQDVIHLADTVRDGSPLVVIADPAMRHLLMS